MTVVSEEGHIQWGLPWPLTVTMAVGLIHIEFSGASGPLIEAATNAVVRAHRCFQTWEGLFQDSRRPAETQALMALRGRSCARSSARVTVKLKHCCYTQWSEAGYKQPSHAVAGVQDETTMSSLHYFIHSAPGLENRCQVTSVHSGSVFAQAPSFFISINAHV